MNVDFADEEMIAYRESLIEKKKEQPFWKKKCLSVNETAAYTGIGRGKIREFTYLPNKFLETRRKP